MNTVRKFIFGLLLYGSKIGFAPKLRSFQDYKLSNYCIGNNVWLDVPSPISGKNQHLAHFHFNLYQCTLCIQTFYSFQIVAAFLSVCITGDSQEELGQ